MIIDTWESLVNLAFALDIIVGGRTATN